MQTVHRSDRFAHTDTGLRRAGVQSDWVLPAVGYCGATFMDMLTTTLALGMGLREGNPVAGPFIAAYGLPAEIVVSAFLCAVLTWYARKGGVRLVYVLAIIRWLVVLNNMIQLVLANH
jgi:hypothetical protein